MTQTNSTGRTIGLLLLVHLVTGLILPYVLLLPVSVPAGAFLDTAAGMAGMVRLCVLMLTVGGAASIAIAVLAWPTVRERQPRLALLLIVLAAMNFTLQLIENAHWLSLLSLSQAYAAAIDPQAAIFQPLGLAAHAAFRWAHYTHIGIVVGWLFTFYLLLHRAALIPRALCAFAMIAALLQFVGITLPAFGGYRMPFPEAFGMPLAAASLAAALWLVAKGFAGPASHEGPAGQPDTSSR